MIIALLVAGIGLLLAGLAGIAYGIPIKEFSFGNTVIIAGAIAACTGAIMIGLWLVVRELRTIAQQFAPGVAARTAFTAPLPASGDAPHQVSDTDGFLFNQPGAANPAVAAPATPSGAPPPWHEETASRDRGRSEAPPVQPAEAAPAVKPRRNLLFSSSSRKERERAEGRADAQVTDPRVAPAIAPPAAEPAPATFEDAWPQSERARTAETPPRRSGRSPSASSEANSGADRAAPAVRAEEPPAVTVLKSGVVDGMAYSLYSDGSIEAQMPEGMMRFASIDDLRTHLDQRT